MLGCESVRKRARERGENEYKIRCAVRFISQSFNWVRNWLAGFVGLLFLFCVRFSLSLFLFLVDVWTFRPYVHLLQLVSVCMLLCRINKFWCRARFSLTFFRRLWFVISFVFTSASPRHHVCSWNEKKIICEDKEGWPNTLTHVWNEKKRCRAWIYPDCAGEGMCYVETVQLFCSHYKLFALCFHPFVCRLMPFPIQCFNQRRWLLLLLLLFCISLSGFAYLRNYCNINGWFSMFDWKLYALIVIRSFCAAQFLFFRCCCRLSFTVVEAAAIAFGISLRMTDWLTGWLLRSA